MSVEKEDFCEMRYSDIPDIREDGSENIRYDDPDLPIFCRRNDIPARCILSGMSVHWHSDVEFICIRKGSAFYQLNGSSVKLNAGEGIFVNSRQLHMLVMGDEDCQLDCIIFHPLIVCSSKHIEEKYVYSVISNVAVPYLLLHESVPWERELLESLSLMYELSLKEDSELSMMCAVYKIWELLYKNIPGNASASGRYDDGFRTIKLMIAYIQDNYKGTVTLNGLCRAGGVGRTACTKLFERYVNCTPIEYVRRYRISKSIELLRSTDLTVTEVAFETGFSGTSYFIKTFKEMTGITPVQLKKEGMPDV